MNDNYMPVVFQEVMGLSFAPLMCFFELLDLKVVLTLIVGEKLINADLRACAHISTNEVSQLSFTCS